MANRAGEYKTQLSGDMQYRSFVPNALPPDPPLAIDSDLIELLSKANRAIGQLEGIAGQLPDLNLFVTMYVRKEALLSSQIEGTQATLDDLLDPELEVNANQDVADVINYIRAVHFARQRLNDLPICSRLLKEIHAVLMHEVRGAEKNPGEFRRSQNWIGPAGSTLKTARFIPPSVEDMEQAMSDLERFIHSEDHLDPLIKAALIHYQFETIHPFLDGNGRIGRMMITLYLIDRGLLSQEVLYLSYFLKRNQIEYYDRLTEVRMKGHFEQWIRFFLLAVYETALDAIDTIHSIQILHAQNVSRLPLKGRSASTLANLFAYIETKPIIDIKKTSNELNLAYNTVASAVNKLVELGILQTDQRVKKGRLFIYEDYLAILRKGT